MTIEEIRARYDQEQRIRANHTGMRREEADNIVRYVSEYDTSSVVLYTTLDSKDADAAIAEQIAYFSGIGHEFEWKLFGHDTPADLGERLLAHGLEEDELEAIVVLDLQELPPVLDAPVTADIRRVTSPEQLQELIALEEQVWGEDRGWLHDQLSYEMRATPDLLSIYTVYVDEAPASTGWVRFDARGTWAGLWGGSTLPAYRKRGIYTALVAHRAQEAITRGYRFLTVDASSMSRPILERLGFRQITTAIAYTWRPERE